MPISSFGIFASMLMLSNYLFVITSFPAALINVENFKVWLENWKLKSNKKKFILETIPKASPHKET